jgi:TonB family protein
VLAGSIYLAGLLLLLTHIGFSWRTARRLRSLARPILDRDAVATLDRRAAAAGLRSSPTLMESAAIAVPITMSVVRPVLVLPDDWREWSAERLDAVLIHELAHVARRDALTQRMTLFYRAMFWFSPLSWWLHRRISQLAEQASDEAALHAGIAPVSYAETLLECFEKLQRQPRRAEWHVAMARRADADAARRLERILTWKGGRLIMRTRLWFVALLFVSLSITGVTASVRLSSVIAEPPALPALPAVTVPYSHPQPATLTPPRFATVEQSSRVRSQTPATTPAVQAVPPAKPTPPSDPQQSTRPVSQETPEEFAAGAYDKSTPGVELPKVVREVKPKYTAEAMRAKIQGMVTVELIVGKDGKVTKARVSESLDQVLGLDEQALVAVKQWSFIPGTLNGEAVAVLVKIDMQFRLH